MAEDALSVQDLVVSKSCHPPFKNTNTTHCLDSASIPRRQDKGTTETCLGVCLNVFGCIRFSGILPGCKASESRETFYNNVVKDGERSSRHPGGSPLTCEQTSFT
jgi:hypothetical protein